MSDDSHHHHHDHGCHHHHDHGSHHHHDHGGHHHHDHGHGHQLYRDHPELETLGVELYLGVIYSQTGKTAPELSLLDCGCGRGLYDLYLLRKGLGKATLIDMDESALEKAAEQLAEYKDKVTMKKVKLPDLPFDDATFDVVMMNNMLHHVHEPGSMDYTAIAKSFSEVKRVLKPDGIIMINESTPLQSILQWAKEYPYFAKVYLPMVLTSKAIEELLKNCGFSQVHRLIVPNEHESLKAVSTGQSGDEPSEEKLPDYDTMVDFITCPDERKRLHALLGCTDQIRDLIGRFNIYYALKG